MSGSGPIGAAGISRTKAANWTTGVVNRISPMALVFGGWIFPIPLTNEPGLTHDPSMPAPIASSVEHGCEPGTSVGSRGSWTPQLRTVSVGSGAVLLGSPIVKVYGPTLAGAQPA